MAKLDVITIGGAVKDITFYTDQGKIFSTPGNLTAQKMLAFEYGAKIGSQEVYINWGGGAGNSAVSLSRLGLRTGIIIQIGDDETGIELLKNFKKEKINTNLIQKAEKEQTGFSFILGINKKEKEHVAFSYRGANNKLNITPKIISKADAGWFYITSISGKNWLKNLKTAFDSAAKKNIKIAWNPGNLQLKGGKRLLTPFLKKTQILILNKDEAIELVLSGIKLGKKNPNHLNRPLYLLNILQEWGPKIIVITEGKKGAWVFDGKKIHRQKAIKGKVFDTTGVGDAFGSTFLAGFIENQDIKKALKLAALNSNSVTKKIGAQNGLLTRKKILEKL